MAVGLLEGGCLTPLEVAGGQGEGVVLTCLEAPVDEPWGVAPSREAWAEPQGVGEFPLEDQEEGGTSCREGEEEADLWLALEGEWGEGAGEVAGVEPQHLEGAPRWLEMWKLAAEVSGWVASWSESQL